MPPVLNVLLPPPPDGLELPVLEADGLERDGGGVTETVTSTVTSFPAESVPVDKDTTGESEVGGGVGGGEVIAAEVVVVDEEEGGGGGALDAGGCDAESVLLGRPVSERGELGPVGAPELLSELCALATRATASSEISGYAFIVCPSSQGQRRIIRVTVTVTFLWRLYCTSQKFEATATAFLRSSFLIKFRRPRHYLPFRRRDRQGG
jgi:hypothetical protein